MQTLSAKFNHLDKSNEIALQNNPDLLLNRLSFSHFVELLNTNNPLQRSFYEIHAIKNNWGVRQLKRAINSMLFERTGLSTDKENVIEKYANEADLKPEEIFRNP